jgi:hypothetical protein
VLNIVSCPHLEKDGLGKHSGLTCSKYSKFCSEMIKRMIWLRFDVAVLKKFHYYHSANILFLEHFSAGLPHHLLLLLLLIIIIILPLPIPHVWLFSPFCGHGLCSFLPPIVTDYII